MDSWERYISPLFFALNNDKNKVLSHRETTHAMHLPQKELRVKLKKDTKNPLVMLPYSLVCWTTQEFIRCCTVSCQSGPTCSHKEDASTEQDVVLIVVDASCPDTQATQHQQNGAEDGEQA